MKFKLTVAAALVAALSCGLVGCSRSGSSSDPNSGPLEQTDTIASTLIMGGPPEMKTRADGLPGLERRYDVVFGRYIVTDTGGPVTVNALRDGQIDAANIFTTNPALASEDFVVLEDPEHNFAAQNVVPLLRKDKDTPGLRTTLDAISAQLTTDGLIAMNSQLSAGTGAADVAARWLTARNLATPGDALADTEITVASANFAENTVLGEIYAQALELQGARVNRRINLGSREDTYRALQAGTIDLVPEYSGSLLVHVDRNATEVTSEEVLAALHEALPEELEVLTPAAAENSDAVVVTAATAEKYHLTSIADLAEPAP